MLLHDYLEKCTLNYVRQFVPVMWSRILPGTRRVRKTFYRAQRYDHNQCKRKCSETHSIAWSVNCELGRLWQNATVAYFDVRYRLEICLWGHGKPMECVSKGSFQAQRQSVATHHGDISCWWCLTPARCRVLSPPLPRTAIHTGSWRSYASGRTAPPPCSYTPLPAAIYKVSFTNCWSLNWQQMS